MSITNGYLRLDELQTTLGASTTSTKADDYERAIAAASRWIDGFCSCPQIGIVRHFWQTATPEVRVFQAASPWVVRTGDFADSTTTTVETLTDTGWSALAGDLWQAEPFVRINDYPFTTITATSYTATFPLSMAATVRVTARWGWSAVPAAVAQACQILAVASLVGVDVISNEDGYSVGSKGPTNPIDLASTILDPYVPDEVKDYRASMMAKAKG